MERKEAIEVIKKNWPDSSFTMLREALETLIPELQESEDERIRKFLIDFIKVCRWSEKEDQGWPSKEDCIVWLEKQGEPTDINPSEFDLRLNKLLKQFETLPKEELASSLSFYLNVVQNDRTYKADEKKGEQKSSDEVEPKFKVGDWVITPNNATKQIKRVTFGNYCFTDETFYNIIDTDNKGHLWTIDNAKDGDVLATPNYLYIFNSIDKETETISFYCLMKKSDEHFSFGDYKIHDEILNSTPAAQEQRDLLFAKMKEAGYKWDAEKKELNKIDKKPAELSKSEVTKTSDQVWSEEDEDLFDDIVRYIRESFSGFVGDRYIKMLKSLKDKVQPQQEWSEEDERNWNNIWDVLDGRFELSDYGYKEAAKWFLENCPKGIKPLRQQPKQELSKKEESKKVEEPELTEVEEAVKNLTDAYIEDTIRAFIDKVLDELNKLYKVCGN